MTDFTLSLVDAIISGRATDIETAFQEAITDKISIVMDTRRTEIAQSMFTKESVEEEELTLEDYSVEELEDFMMSEDFEQLDEEEQEILFELSQGLKDRYIKAATASKNSNTKQQKQYKASSDKHFGIANDHAKKQLNLAAGLKKTNNSFDKRANVAYKVKGHSTQQTHHQMIADYSSDMARRHDDVAKKREAGLKRANPNPKPSFLQRVKKKIGLGEELYLEDYSVEELEDFMMSEDFEQLDELSRKTLSSYIGKARSSRNNAVKDLYKSPEGSAAERDKNRKTANNRTDGKERAIDTLRGKTNKDRAKKGLPTRYYTEEFEQLDEVSKKTLGSYVTKAHDQLMKHTAASNFKSGRGDADAFAYSRDEKTMRKEKNRKAGVATAISKLTKESFDIEDYSIEELEDFMMSEDFEQLDELSKKTLGSYVKKATSDVGLAGFVKGSAFNNPRRSKDYDDAAAMNKKRKVGIAKAVDKLTK